MNKELHRSSVGKQQIFNEIFLRGQLQNNVKIAEDLRSSCLCVPKILSVVWFIVKQVLSMPALSYE